MKTDRVKECLSPEAINNRFLNSTNKFTERFINHWIKDNPWVENEESKIARYMQEHNCTRAKAKKIIKAEFQQWQKEYNSPLKVAERRIAELEAHLELIKNVIEDPHYMDKFD